MTTHDIGLFKAMTAKMDYLSQRQKIISQNVANADTPNYHAHDLKAVDFGTVLQTVTKDNVLRPVTDNPLHIPSPNDIDKPENSAQRKTYEVAPDGNAVIMEEQMVKSTQTTMDYNLMTSLYQKSVGMLTMAIDRGGSQ